MVIELGKKYCTKTLGFEGIATAETKFLTGCNRVCLQTMKDGDIKEYWFDVSDLVDVELPKEHRKPGGPGQIPTSKDHRRKQ